MKTKLTKKEFKEMCGFHEYTSKGTKINAIFFDHDGRNGYKFMVKAYAKNRNGYENITKTELFNEFYQWVTQQIQQVSYYIGYRYAETDEQRFKVPISIKM